ncbi:unnamed protein product [Prorocentrum cordatum]|uniref:Uncharacterized protein n=1 Tax=Prorocentrum cordatum TaxID=2364126 RepID=A0ABN9XHC0_9DINO|nr:unnamed protein product [Polarella glacialis]
MCRQLLRRIRRVRKVVLKYMDPFRWALFGYYIFIGTVQVILMKASGESAKGTGKGLAYNTASAMIFIEGSKIICCLAVESWQGDAVRKEAGETRRTTTLGGWAYYAIPGFLYAVENNLKIPATVILHPHVFALFNNSKVIFAAVGMVLLLGRRFSVLQWMSMVLLGASLCVAKVEMLLPAPEARECASAPADATPPRALATRSSSEVRVDAEEARGGAQAAAAAPSREAAARGPPRLPPSCRVPRPLREPSPRRRAQVLGGGQGCPRPSSRRRARVLGGEPKCSEGDRVARASILPRVPLLGPPGRRPSSPPRESPRGPGQNAPRERSRGQWCLFASPSSAASKGEK